MSDLTQLENGLATWFTWATGYPAVWSNAPQPTMQIGPYAILDGPTNVQSTGQDYVKYTWTGSAMAGAVQARRSGEIGVRIISDVQTPGNSRAGWIFELFRMSAVLPEVIEALTALDMAVSTFTTVAQFDAPGHGGRMTSIQSGVIQLLWGLTALQPATDYGVIRSISGQALIDSAFPYTWSAGP